MPLPPDSAATPSAAPPSVPPATPEVSTPQPLAPGKEAKGRPASLGSFFLIAILWLVPITIGWVSVSGWLARPAMQVAHMALEFSFPQWVAHVKKSANSFEVETRLVVSAPPRPGTEPGVAVLVVDTRPARLGFGLPLFLALILASRRRNPLGRALLGTVCLVPAQAFGIYFDILREVVVQGGAAAVTQAGFAGWQVEGIVLAYQFGSLLLPTLMPVILWLWLERDFFADVILDGWLRKAPPRPPGKPAEAAPAGTAASPPTHPTPPTPSTQPGAYQGE